MTALLAALLGAVSLLLDLTASRPAPLRRALLGGAGAVILVLALLGGLALLEVGVLGTLLVVGVAVLWGASALLLPGESTVLLRWGLGLAVLGACALAAPVPGGTGGAVVTVSRGALVAGVLALEATPANGLVAAVLSLARGRGAAGGATVCSCPVGAGGGHPDAPPVISSESSATSVASLAAAAAAAGALDEREQEGSALRGGRWIGPLERVLIVLLAGAGAQAALAAVIAAKGVIRFPEISQDAGGRKAEEFLIGSLASWSLAVLGVLLLTA